VSDTASPKASGGAPVSAAARGRTGRDVAEGLLRRGVLAKDTHTWTIRFAPPLTIEEPDLQRGIDAIVDVLGDRARGS
jgi:ornithine--oxo-acid transaminase